MADTIREQIIKAYCNHLSTMKVANGYNFNCGINVFRGFRRIEENFMPSASIFVGNDEDVQKNYGSNLITMKMRVEALALFDATDELSETLAVETSEALLGDIIKCMTRQDITVSNLIDDIQYLSGGQEEVPESDHYVSGAFAEFNVKYYTQIGNPYQQ